MQTGLLNKHGNRRGMSSGSRANMSQPGQTHNPRGGSSLSLVALLKEELARVPSKASGDLIENKEGLTNAKLLVQQLMADALDGNTTLIKEILDRVDGKVTIPVSGPDGGPIQQEMKIISAGEIRPALEALVGCGAIQVNTN